MNASLIFQIVCLVLVVVMGAGTVCLSTYTRWVYDVKIPAIRAGRPIPPMPRLARIGDRLTAGKPKGDA